MTLGHKLGADNDIGLATCDFFDLRLQRAGRAEQIG